MLRHYPNLSEYIHELMELNQFDASMLSIKADIKLNVIEQILAGYITSLGFKRTIKLSQAFGMRINHFIDFISQ